MESLTFLFHFNFIFRLILAIIISGCIGIVQYSYEKGSHVNSFILIAIGTTIFSYITFIFSFETDAIFIFATVALAVSFITTGLIFKTHNLIKDYGMALTLWVIGIIGACLGSKYWGLGLEASFLVLIYFLSRRLFMRYSQTSHQKYFAINLEILKLNTIDQIEELAEKCRFQILSKNFVRSDNFHFEMEYMAHPLAHRVFLKKLFRIKDFGTIVKISS